MPVQQVSVFLDNRPGSLSEVISYLAKSKILEAADFYLAKSRKNIEVSVILITENNTVARITKILAENDLNIDYAYSSAVHIDGKFALVLRVSDLDKAERILEENGVIILSFDEIKKSFQ
jgi:hypothetical protein